MMNKPSIDIVILSWNRAQLTAETVENVLAQEHVRPAIWIVDQGSNAKSLSIIRDLNQKHPSVHVIELGKNVGVPAGRDIGMRLGNSRYITIIDNDAVFESTTALSQVIKRFDKDQRLGVIGFRIKNFYTNADDKNWWAYPKEQFGMRNHEFITTRFSGCAHTLCRKAFDETRGYDAKLFFYWEEVDLSNQIINLGYQIIYDPSITVLHKISPESRVQWNNNRYYFLTRNAIYLHVKYYRDYPRTLLIILGYIVKGIYNSALLQALHGIKDASKMCRVSMPEWEKSPYILNHQARAYIHKHELRHRGNIWMRIKTEVFAKLPGKE